MQNSSTIHTLQKDSTRSRISVKSQPDQKENTIILMQNRRRNVGQKGNPQDGHQKPKLENID